LRAHCAGCHVNGGNILRPRQNACQFAALERNALAAPSHCRDCCRRIARWAAMEPSSRWWSGLVGDWVWQQALNNWPAEKRLNASIQGDLQAPSKIPPPNTRSAWKSGFHRAGNCRPRRSQTQALPSVGSEGWTARPLSFTAEGLRDGRRERVCVFNNGVGAIRSPSTNRAMDAGVSEVTPKFQGNSKRNGAR